MGTARESLSPPAGCRCSPRIPALRVLAESDGLREERRQALFGPTQVGGDAGLPMFKALPGGAAR